MNIFYLDPDPKICAQYHCDKHSTKMCVEYAQLLSTAHRVLDGTVSDTISASGRRKKVWALADDRDSVLYTATHVNHPSAIWCRENLENYHWLYRLFHELCHEYTYRYGKVHACARLLDELRFPPTKIPLGQFFAPTPAMPPELKILADVHIPGRKYNVLKSYHNYYIQEKASFAKWKNRNIPEWFANAYV